MIVVTSQARDYDPAQVTDRYVRYDGGGCYVWCETGPLTDAGWRYDIRQGTCTILDISDPNVAFRAIECHNERIWPSYVEWPLGD